MNRWHTLSSQVVLDHPVLKVEVASRRRSQGELHDFVVLHSPDWVNVVPVTGDGRVVLIRQWRHGSRGCSLEIPGGMVDPGETPLEAGARELLEETGFAARGLAYLGRVNPNPALFDNTCHTFLAMDAEPAAPQRPDDTEVIEVVLAPLADLPGMVRRGEIHHSLVLAALTFYWLEKGWPLPAGGD